MFIKVCHIVKGNSISTSKRLFIINGRRCLSKGYVPNEVESNVATLWKTVSFIPSSSHESSSKFSMVLPPPNVTGTLHLGHALTTTLQDVIAKRCFMSGKDVRWIPGLDHAGIATQAIVESVLSSSGLDSRSMERQTLLQHIDKWKETKSEVIRGQLKALAPSLDWNNEFFTLDERQSTAVFEAFRQLFEAGLIYRAERLVNWCVKLGSAISDMEVEHRQISGRTTLRPPSSQIPVVFGQMIDVAFKVYNKSDDELIVSTCRIETMPGDSAVAVHPDDQRYFRFHGCQLVHPLSGRLLPLILDPSVDPNFGTGAMKVTPGHDQSDFDMSLKHGLELISVIDETGCLNSNAGQYAGINRFEARQVISEVLGERGHIRNIRDHQMSIPLCSRTSDVIELISKPQWFLKCSEMSSRAVEAVEKGQLEIIPEQYVKLWNAYLENSRDWCISRQVVWGHRLPLLTDGEDYFTMLNHQGQDKKLHQVSDVLDTWFSSALLPFSAFGWPNNMEEVKRYFPLDLMITGHDILFFWVARMVMLSLQLTDALPFKKVLLHSVICDPQGRKMSKSLGNVIDPQHVIQGISHQGLLDDLDSRLSGGMLKKEEADLARVNISKLLPEGIPQCGTDALRLSLLSHRVKNHYIYFDTEACYVNKLFCNKLWQACRFTLDWSSKLLPNNTLDRQPVASRKIDIWLLNNLIDTVRTVNTSLDNFDFHIAVNSIKDFVHHSFCDIYLESVKEILRSRNEKEANETCYILLYCLVNVIKLLAPMAPFVSEQLYQSLQPQHNGMISVHQSQWPTVDNTMINLPSDVEVINKEVTACLSIIKEIRKLKFTLKDTKSQTLLTVGLLSTRSNFSSDLFKLIEILSKCKIQLLDETTENWSLFSTLGQELSIFYSSPKKTDASSLVVKPDDAKRLEKIEKELEKMIRMTSHENYRSKVLESVQKSHSDKILKLQVEIQQLKDQM